MNRFIRSNLRLVLLLSLLLKGLMLFSQNTPAKGVAVPPSPVAQSFELFGKYPVTAYTGLADISISILQRKVDGFDLNVALRYHPSGIKVNQTASWVGLGWNVSGVGTITRSINGVADEDPNGILNTKKYYPASLLDMNHCENERFNPNVNPENFLFLTDVAEGVQDSESDYYFLNLGGISCQFIVKPDGKCETLPLSNIIIEYVGGYTWRVKDEQGNIFIFDEYETTRSVVRNGGTIDRRVDKTAWYLRKVITARGQEIVYNYQTAGCTSSPIRNESLCYYYKDPVNHYIPDDILSITTDEIIYNTPVLKWITFPGGKLLFELENVNPRLDQNIPVFPLKKIKLYNGRQELLSEYEPIYSYFVSDDGLDLDKSLYKRLKLSEIIIASNKNLDISVKKYSFNYYEDVKLPAINSCAQDYWGFYNGAITNDSPTNKFGLIPNEVFAEKGLIDKYQGAMRNPKFPEMMAWSLKSITYPSGGRLEFIYSPHECFIEKGTVEEKEVMQTYRNSFNNNDAVQNNINNDIGSSTQDHEFVVNGITGRITEAKFVIKLSPNTGGMMRHVIKLISMTTNTICFSEEYINNYGSKNEYKEAYLTSGDRYILRMQSNTYKPDEIELNYQYFIKQLDVSMDRNEILGGLRVSKIINYKDKQDTSPLFTEYRYVNGEKSSGLYHNVKKFNRGISDTYLPLVQTICGSCLEYPITNRMELFSSNSYDGLGESKGASTGYGRVEVWQGQVVNSTENKYYGGHTVHYYGGVSDNYIIENQFSGYVAYYPIVISKGGTSGATVYNSLLTYAKYNDGVFNGPFPYFTTTRKDWEDGIFWKEEFFSDKNELVKRTVNYNSYGVSSKIIGEGLKVSSNPYLLYKKEGTTDPIMSLPDNYFFRKYEIVSNRVSLDSTVITDFLDGKALSKSTRYTYDPLYHMVKGTAEVTPLTTKIISIQYPFDYQSAICNTMTSNRLFPPIERIEKVNGRSVRGEKHDYELGTFNTKLNRNLINLIGSYRWATDRWDKVSTITYNTEGDIVEVGRKGLISSYLWGSNKDCPVVSATGLVADSLKSQFKKTGYENNIDTLVKRVGNLETESQRTLYAQFNRDLRGGLGKEVQVETYTHEPLWGLTSKTDSRSRTSRYEYDGFSRLCTARDNEEKYVGQFGYRYYDNLRPEVYANAAKSGTFTKSNCAAGGVSSSITYTVAAGKYTSTVSQADADTKAQNDVNTNGQAYANTNGTCSFSSAAKSGIFTKNSCAEGGVGSSVTYMVAAGKYTSTVSQADADAKAQNDVTANGQVYANTNGTCTFSSAAKSGTFSMNSCAAGGIGSSVTYTVTARKYTSTVSQADADAKAQNDVNTNGQAYANTNGTCTFSSAAKSSIFTKNSCAVGGVGSSVTYTVPAGKYTSTISQANADAKAQNDVSTNGQAYANTNGTCIFSSAAKSGIFTKNSCAAGGVGSSVTYTVPVGRYTSIISQADADAKAQNDITANGQAYANTNGTCTFSSTAKSGSFAKNNCANCSVGNSVTYTVPAGRYPSTVSKADADAKAQNDVNGNGQAYANANGTCITATLSVIPESLFPLRRGLTGLLGTVQVTSSGCWNIIYDQMGRPTPYVEVRNESNVAINFGCGNMNLKIYQIEGLRTITPSAVIIKTTDGCLQQTISIGDI